MDLETRLKQHQSKWTHCTALKAGIDLYGWDAFDVEILERPLESELCKREIFWIAHFDTYKGKGYNQTPGGDDSPMKLPEVREKMKMTLADPEVKARHNKSKKIAFNTPEVRANRKRIANDPEFKKKQKIAMSNPEVKAKRSASAKAACMRPEVKSKKQRVMKEVQNRPDVKKKKSDANKAAHADAEVRKRWLASVTAANKSASAAEARRLANLRPDVIAKRSAAQKAVWERRRAAKKVM
tara:strand:- start:62 stop:781 length:720 start_codon:yes stop_codon:yes gene_type:complete